MKTLILLFLSVTVSRAGVGSLGGTPYSAFEPEVVAYGSNIVSMGGSIEFADILCIDRFAKSAKVNGYWDSLLEVGPLAGNQLTAALVKLKAYTGLSITLTNQNFVSGDYFRSTGLTGGSGKFLKTGFDCSAFGNQNVGLGFFVNGEYLPSSGQFPLGLSTAISPYLNILLVYNPANTSQGQAAYNGSGSATVEFLSGAGNRAGTGKGFYYSRRSSGSSLKSFFNGNAGNSYTTPETITPANYAIDVFAGSAGTTTATGYFTSTGTFYSIDNGGLTDNQAALFAGDVRQLQRELGRYVPAKNPQKKVIIIGQSLSIGSQGTPLLSTNQSFHNRGFSLLSNGYQAGCAMLNFTPWVETGTETIASGMANLVSSTWRSGHSDDDTQDLLISNWGVGGAGYTTIKKGSAAYLASIAAVSNAVVISADYSSGVVVPGIACVHGESDWNSTTYASDVAQWQSDYQTDVQAKTGQTNEIPIFHSQISAWTSTANGNSATAVSPYQLLSAFEANHSKTILVCPKYIFDYASDGVHLTNSAMYRWLGEYYAKAWHNVVVLSGTWSPLRPASIARTGSNIDITFTGNSGALTLDTTMVSNPGSYGFEYFDDTSPPAISSVSITGSNTIRIVLASTPTGSGKRIRYAYTGIAGNRGGPTTGPRGNLRDSDTSFVSNYGNSLYNWCVHFDKECP